MPDYVPSWINDCYTLLSKVNKCIEKTEEVLTTLDRKQDELNTTQLSAVNSGITQAKVEHYDTIPIVVGNPTGSGTVNLIKLKVGNTIYLIPQGTEVEGNPTESGSVNLTKIKIGDTIYNIPSGESGGVYLHRLYLGNIGTYVYFKTSFSTPITPQNATTLFGFDSYNDWMVFAYAQSEIRYIDYIPCLYSFLGNDAVIRWNDDTTENSWTDTVIEL